MNTLTVKAHVMLQKISISNKCCFEVLIHFDFHFDLIQFEVLILI